MTDLQTGVLASRLQLTEIFGNLDEIAALQAKAVKGNFCACRDGRPP